MENIKPELDMWASPILFIHQGVSVCAQQRRIAWETAQLLPSTFFTLWAVCSERMHCIQIQSFE